MSILNSISRFTRPYLLGLLLLLAAYIGVRFALTRRPSGSMTVLESQGMSMNGSSSAPGATPVATEAVKESLFAPTVVYTGSVVALNDVEVFPRVTGVLRALSVYPGDHVRAGQSIGRLDSTELSSRLSEAAAGRQASQEDAAAAESEYQQALSQVQSSEAKVRSLAGSFREAQAQVVGGQAMREQAKHEVDAARSGLADVQANVVAMQADADYWKSEVAREQRLYKRGAVSTDEYQREVSQNSGAQAKLAQAEAAVQTQGATLAAARSKIQQAGAGIVGAQARQDQIRAGIQSAQADAAGARTGVGLSERRVRQRTAMASQGAAQARTAGIVQGYTELRSSQDGIVTERLVSPGTLVQPGTPVLRIKSVGKVRLQANVAASDLAGIHVGNPVTVTSTQDAGFRLQAHITAIFDSASPESRTITVEALVSNPGTRLIPGQYIVMQIATALSRPMLTVPLSAIRHDAGPQPFVWVVAGTASGKKTAHRVTVTLGSGGGARAVVTSGLHPADVGIYQGNEDLSEGDAVTPTLWGDGGPDALQAPSKATPTSGQSGGMPGMPGM